MAGSIRCHYEVLEVERTANDDEIKKSFRKLALKVCMMHVHIPRKEKERTHLQPHPIGAPQKGVLHKKECHAPAHAKLDAGLHCF